MEHVSVDDIDPESYDGDLHTDRYQLSDPLGAEHVAITRYVLEPGERFSGSIYAHFDQEEMFVVLALGAPRDTEDIHISRIPVLDDRDIACPDCECEHMRISRTEADFECPDCGATLILEEA